MREIDQQCATAWNKQWHIVVRNAGYTVRCQEWHVLPTAYTNPKRKRGSGLRVPRLRFGLVLDSAAKSIWVAAKTESNGPLREGADLQRNQPLDQLARRLRAA